MFSLLGLHGSSGHPRLIKPFITALARGLPSACPRGTFVDGDGYTFFKRLADRTIPTLELIALAKESVATGGFVSNIGRRDALLVGYSSGAIFAHALLAVAPSEFVGAILLRPEPIGQDFGFPELDGKPILIISGEHDQRRKPRDGFVVAEQLSRAGAQVAHYHLDAGHGWAASDQDLILSTTWMAQTYIDGERGGES